MSNLNDDLTGVGWWRDAGRKSNPEFYLGLLPRIRKIARIHGYAIAVHGSLNRDLDLIAVPWRENVSAPAVLAEAIAAALPGVFNQKGANEGKPAEKPHGRLAWAIVLGRGRFVDLSVIPPRAD